jgi:adenine deaminase
MEQTRLTSAQLQRRIAAAQGKIPCDLIFKDIHYLDVFSCEWKESDVAISDGVVVGLDSGLSAKQTIDSKGKWLVPGFIDAHVHVESSLLVPSYFEKSVLSRGTTTAVCDPHELANVAGVEGISYFLQAAESLKLDLRVMLSSCVPATHLETNGGGSILAQDLLPLSSHPKALGLAEMMNMPGVLNCDPSVIEKLELFSGGVIDGHCPLLTGKNLSAYAAAGISSCHESTRLEEALEKLTKGIAVWIREGSVAKDLKALSPMLTMARSTSIGFCTDDRNPLDIHREGHIDYLVRTAIRYGVTPEVAYRSSSWSVARHYGLKYKGAVAPGYCADLILLNDAKTCEIDRVFKDGVSVSDLPESKVSAEFDIRNTVNAHIPETSDLEGPKGRVHVIEVLSGSILTGRRVCDSSDPGVARLSVLERYGKRQPPANGYVFGFGENFQGAIASSVGHDSHNLIVVGKRTSDMQAALSALIHSGGGFCVVKNGNVVAHLPLPFGGLMSTEDPGRIVEKLTELREAARAVQCEMSEPFLQLAFLSLPVIPSLKLTDRGLVDVDAFKIIDVRAA